MSHVALGLIVKDDQVLLVKRVKQDGIVWGLPGGKIEPTESDREAVQREVKEETGIVCEPMFLIGERVHPITNDQVSYWSCEAKTVNAQVISPEEIAEVGWVDINTALQYLGNDLFLPIKTMLSE